MLQRGKFVFVGVLTSTFVGTACVAFLSFSSNLTDIANWLLIQGVALVVIGASIGIVADRLGVSLVAVISGAALGWLGGAIPTTYLFKLFNLEITQSSGVIPYLLLQILFGVMIGITPSGIAYFSKHRGT